MPIRPCETHDPPPAPVPGRVGREGRRADHDEDVAFDREVAEEPDDPGGMWHDSVAQYEHELNDQRHGEEDSQNAVIRTAQPADTPRADRYHALRQGGPIRR